MNYFYILILLLLSSSCSSCSILSKKNDRNTPKSPDIPKTWEERFEIKLQSGSFKQAWGLFSYGGGYQDAGQIMVFQSLSNSTGTLDFVDRSKGQITSTRTLDKSEMSKFLASISKSVDLTDFDSGAFDGITYTFIHLKKDGNKIIKEKKIRMNNPHTANPPPDDHLELISQFEDLTTSR